MTGLIRSQLTGLAAQLSDLKDRVRVAVAGELGRLVSGAVQQVVQALVAGGPVPPPPAPRPAYRPPSASRWDDEEDDDRWGRPRDPWSDEDEDRDDPDRAARPVTSAPPDGEPRSSPPAAAAVPAAVAAGVYAARWWLACRGTLLAAVGVGLGVGLLGALGGPLVRTAIAALAAAADILCAADALGAGAARLGRH